MADPHSPSSVSGSPCRRGGRTALGLLLALLLLAEGAARLAGPAMPSCADMRRNPYRFRGWPEYVEAARGLTASNRVVVVLSNCQGYGAEHPGRLGYPAILQTVLNEQGPAGDRPWRVVNWSLDGATSMEYVMLAAYLHQVQPAAVVVPIAFADFRAEHFAEGWRYSRSDVSRLAVRPSVWRRLPRAFLRRHAKVEDVLASGAFDRLALLRVAEYGWSWLEGRLPGSHYTLYAPAINYRPWRIERLRPLAPKIRTVGMPLDQELNLLYDERSAVMVDELAAVLAASGLPVALAAQPFRDKHLYARHFARDLKAAAGRHGLACWDLRRAIPAEEYLTSNHLSRQGHRRMAQELATRMGPWLERREGSAP
jgi:hypothetical protein